MGVLRLYLAICVLAAHAKGTFPLSMHGGRESVQIFYLISGFYMAHIGSKYNSSIEFYSSRFIRIYTPYYIILLVVITVSLISGYLFDFWGALEPYRSQLDSNGYKGIVLSSLSNISIFFQDWTFFLKDEGIEGFSFTTNVGRSKALLSKYLIIPQAWTVGVELTFYLFVPLLNRQKIKTLLLLLFTSLVLRIFSYEYLGLNHFPWRFRFFPFELSIFILGMLSNRLYNYIKKTKIGLSLPVVRTVSGYFVGICLLFIFIYITKTGTTIMANYISFGYAELISYLVWAMSIPILFLIFGKIRYDRYIGELSYPVYLGHIVVISYLWKIMNTLGLDIRYLGVMASLITISFAIVLYKYIILPVDRKRYEMAKYIAKKWLHLS